MAKKSKSSAQPIQSHMEKKSFPKLSKSSLESKYPLRKSSRGESDTFCGKPPKR